MVCGIRVIVARVICPHTSVRMSKCQGQVLRAPKPSPNRRKLRGLSGVGSAEKIVPTCGFSGSRARNVSIAGSSRPCFLRANFLNGAQPAFRSVRHSSLMLTG